MNKRKTNIRKLENSLRIIKEVTLDLKAKPNHPHKLGQPEIYDIKYKYNPTTRTTKCIVRWYEPITGTNRKTVGVAKYNQSDEYDEIKAKRISESRAKQTIYRIYICVLNSITEDAIYKIRKSLKYEKEHLIKLINE